MALGLEMEEFQNEREYAQISWLRMTGKVFLWALVWRGERDLKVCVRCYELPDGEFC